MVEKSLMWIQERKTVDGLVLFKICAELQENGEYCFTERILGEDFRWCGVPESELLRTYVELEQVLQRREWERTRGGVEGGYQGVQRGPGSASVPSSGILRMRDSFFRYRRNEDSK